MLDGPDAPVPMRNGTPAFMAPEACGGNAVLPLPAETWALGVSLCVLPPPPAACLRARPPRPPLAPSAAAHRRRRVRAPPAAHHLHTPATLRSAP